MAPAPDPEKAWRSRQAILRLGLMAGVVLLVPAFLYSIAPEAPLREGDLVYSTGRHLVYFVDPSRYEETGYTTYCVLEPRQPLLVLRKPHDRPAESLVAQVHGQKPKLERPFCPPQAEVILKPHQVTSKVDLVGEVKDGLARLLTP
ncbi:hypothetical protein [Nitrospira sp. Kam-Ns4a]